MAMKIHYATTEARPGYTPCGLYREYVVITHDWHRVTCSRCITERTVKVTYILVGDDEKAEKE